MIPAYSLDMTYMLAPIAAASIGAVAVGFAAILFRAFQERPNRKRRPVSVEIGTRRLAGQPSAAA